MEIKITRFEASMRDQVIKLFVEEYKVEYNSFDKLFGNFYFHPFQQNKCILIAAMYGETVAGFQSFFYWPYSKGDKTYLSFQSGNSLIHPAYRGKGLFNRMLTFIETEKEKLGIDFLMGFPVEASKKNFMKDNWQNILDLQWYVRTCNPFGFFGKLSSHFTPGLKYFDAPARFNTVLSPDYSKDFIDWRSSYMNKESYYSYSYSEGDLSVIFHLKTNKRKKILNEIIIGNVLFSNEKAITLLEKSLSSLHAKLRNGFSAHFISIAFNEHCLLPLREKIAASGFTKANKKIYFIVKPFIQEREPTDPKKWLLFRADIDTW